MRAYKLCLFAYFPYSFFQTSPNTCHYCNIICVCYNLNRFEDYCSLQSQALITSSKAILKIITYSTRPSVVTDQIVQKIKEMIKNCSSRQELFCMSRSVLHETVKNRVRYRKLCTRWVPKKPTENHKQNRVVVAHTFLSHVTRNKETTFSTVLRRAFFDISPHT